MAVVAEGGELKAAVVAEVQRRWMQMKEAAVHRAREEKLMAERKAKEEKLRTEEVQPAMAALLAGGAEELDKVARDWICADAVERLVAGAGGSGVDGKTAVQAAVAAWRQLKAVRPKTNLVVVREENYQIQKEQSVWDTKANLSIVVGGVLAFDPTSLHSDNTNLDERDDDEKIPRLEMEMTLKWMTVKTNSVPSCQPNDPPHLVELNARLRREADPGMVDAARVAAQKELPPPPPLPSTASAADALGADGPDPRWDDAGFNEWADEAKLQFILLGYLRTLRKEGKILPAAQWIPRHAYHAGALPSGVEIYNVIYVKVTEEHPDPWGDHLADLVEHLKDAHDSDLVLMEFCARPQRHYTAAGDGS
eukprot:jgi/Chrpa1/26455/Chrysochromulina_OHIO_Genome00026820-RA